MIDAEELKKDVRAVESELARAYGVKVDGLEAKLRKVGRRLPRAQHKQAKVLLDATKAMEHPKLRHQVKQARINKARVALMDHLCKVDPKKRRKRSVLGALSGLAFNLLLAFALFVLFYAWKGSV